MSSATKALDLGQANENAVQSGRVARGAMHLVVGQAATTVLSVMLNAVLGRTLGAGDFGLYFFLLTSTYFAHVFTEWGQGSILIRDVAQRPEAGNRLVGSALAIRCVFSVPAALAGALVLRLLGYSLETQSLLFIMVMVFIPTALINVYGLAFRGHDRMDLDARATVIHRAVHFSIVWIALTMGGRLHAVVGSLGLAGIAGLSWAVYKAKQIGLGKPRIARAEVRRLLTDGTPVLALGVMTHAQLYIETLLLSALASASVLGWYAASRTITNTLIMPAVILLSASYPSLSRVAEDHDRLRAGLASTLRPVVILGVFVATGTVLFAETAIGLIYGESAFGPATTLLQLAAPGLVLLFINILFGSVAVLVRRTAAMTAIRLVVMAGIGVLAWKLVPLAQTTLANGAIGLLAATTLGELLMLVGFLGFAPRGMFGWRSLLDLALAVVAGGVGALAVWMIPLPIPVLGIPIFVVAFAGAARALGLVGRDDVQMIRDAVGRRSASR